MNLDHACSVAMGNVKHHIDVIAARHLSEMSKDLAKQALDCTRGNLAHAACQGGDASRTFVTTTEGTLGGGGDGSSCGNGIYGCGGNITIAVCGTRGGGGSGPGANVGCGTRFVYTYHNN